MHRERRGGGRRGCSLVASVLDDLAQLELAAPVRVLLGVEALHQVGEDLVDAVGQLRVVAQGAVEDAAEVRLGPAVHRRAPVEVVQQAPGGADRMQDGEVLRNRTPHAVDQLPPLSRSRTLEQDILLAWDHQQSPCLPTRFD